jgi:hypothetical protein
MGKACQWALTRKRTLWGGSALEVGDLRLLEDGGERGGALNSDLVVPQTESEEQSGDGERSGVSMGVDRKANTQGAAHSRLEICVVLRMAASAEAPLYPMPVPSRLRARGGVGMVKE